MLGTATDVQGTNHCLSAPDADTGNTRSMWHLKRTKNHVASKSLVSALVPETECFVDARSSMECATRDMKDREQGCEQSRASHKTCNMRLVSRSVLRQKIVYVFVVLRQVCVGVRAREWANDLADTLDEIMMAQKLCPCMKV